MPDTAQINRSLSSIKTELEFLQASNVLSPPQFQSIMAQLPVSNISVAHISGSLDFPDSSQGQNGNPSQYIDPRFTNPQQQFNPGQLAQQAQDPNNAAHPQNPNVRISTSSSLSIPPFLNSLSRVRNCFFLEMSRGCGVTRSNLLLSLQVSGRGKLDAILHLKFSCEMS